MADKPQSKILLCKMCCGKNGTSCNNAVLLKVFSCTFSHISWRDSWTRVLAPHHFNFLGCGTICLRFKSVWLGRRGVRSFCSLRLLPHAQLLMKSQLDFLGPLLIIHPPSLMCTHNVIFKAWLANRATGRSRPVLLQVREIVARRFVMFVGEKWRCKWRFMPNEAFKAGVFTNKWEMCEFIY